LRPPKKKAKWFSYTPLNINDSRLLLQRFEQRYPFIKNRPFAHERRAVAQSIFIEDRRGETSST